jgi:tetratricopeptide (TPR) repeat protein
VGITVIIDLYLAEGYWLAGEVDKGRQTARELLKTAECLGSMYELGYAHLLLGEMSLDTEPGQARTHFDTSIDILKKIKAENALASAYAGYGRHHKRQENTDQAREYLTKALEIFERLGTLLEPDKVRNELAELPQGG